MANDNKRSIRDKYKRRLRNLYYNLEQFKRAADERLDEKQTGKN
jgi:hypothetical protein